MNIEKAPWGGVALVCKKCSKKLDGGFGHKNREGLRDVLRDTLKATGRRRALRIIEVGCLGLCPKQAVTMVGPNRTGEVIAVPKGADPAEVLAVLAI